MSNTGTKRTLSRAPQIRKTQSSLQRNPSLRQKQKQASSLLKRQKYKLDFIKKDNYDNLHIRINITQIKQLPIKYTLHCIEGIYKNRFLYITTHKDGQIFGSGQAKQHNLTLQIQNAGLSLKHAQLKFDGFKNFDVQDFNSSQGTWMNIPKQGIQIKNNENFSIGPYVVKFTYGYEINQIEELCMMFNVSYLSDILEYNGVKTLKQLYVAEYTNFKGFPFSDKDVEKIKRISMESKKWYQENKKYYRLIAKIENQPYKDMEIQIGWQSFYFCEHNKNNNNSNSSSQQLLYNSLLQQSNNKNINILAQISKGYLVPRDKVFSRIIPFKFYPLSLHNQLKIGNLMFQLTRFNTGRLLDIGHRSINQDGLLIQQDVGGSEWKLISLFAVFDGHGGKECMQYFKNNLLPKMRQWTNMLDQAGDLNQMLKVLINKTFFQLDYQFYQKYPQLAMTCGCTGQIILIIQSKVYIFSIGDCKGYLFRNQTIYQLSLDHIPSRGDQRSRIQNAGGFVQYDRLMGKCTLSRCLGQFQYKNLDDYQNKMKGNLKSFLSCIPDMNTFDIIPEADYFILLTTDGLLQFLTISQITEFIMERYQKLEVQQSPNKILSSLCETSKMISKQCDNIAAILIILRKGLVNGKKIW